MTRTIKSLFLFLFLFVLYSPLSLAAIDCSRNFIEGSDHNTPLEAMLCPASKALNYAIAASSVVFALYVIYAGVKLSLAWGDPKGFDSARNSLTYSVVGFGIIMGFFILIRIALNLLGVDKFNDPNAIILGGPNSIESKLNIFKNIIGGPP